MEDAFGRLLVYVFTAVCGDVDVFGVKLAQFIDGVEQTVDACALEWGQHLKREGCVRIIRDGVYSVHIGICFE